MPPTDRQQSPDDRPQAADAAESADEVSAEPEALQQALKQTLAGLTSSRELSPQVYAALLEVARTHPGESLSLDPVAIQLVSACLSVQFPLLASRESLSRRMCLWVAESLLADPAARQRLTELWARLGEAPA